jgi:perosamine synthetase
MFQRTFARKCIDITWRDLAIFIWKYVSRPETASQVETDIEKLWSPKGTLVAFTVRSGFDLCLQVCAFPPGSEVIVSAVTIPDMVRIIEYHKLVPIPVDIQEDGSVSANDVDALITPKTRAILIAHLFGNRMAFDEISNFAKRKGIFVFEDCAQAFCGRDFTGHPDADVSMFSFGLIKTSTAFGGALLTIRDPALRDSIRSIRSQYPTQPTSKFWLRVAKYAVFKALTDSGLLYSAFLGVLNLRGVDHHALIRKLSRSFVPENFMVQIRQRPSAPLLQLLRHRVATFKFDRLERRQKMVEHLSSLLPENFRPIGFCQRHHVYWLCPIRAPRPDLLIESLYRAGFDAANGRTSLAVVSQRSKIRPERAENIMEHVAYLPIDHCYDEQTLNRLAGVILFHSGVYGDV